MDAEDPRSYEAALRRHEEAVAERRAAFVKPEDRELVEVGGAYTTRVSDHETRTGSEEFCRFPGSFAQYVVGRTLQSRDDDHTAAVNAPQTAT